MARPEKGKGHKRDRGQGHSNGNGHWDTVFEEPFEHCFQAKDRAFEDGDFANYIALRMNGPLNFTLGGYGGDMQDAEFFVEVDYTVRCTERDGGHFALFPLDLEVESSWNACVPQ